MANTVKIQIGENQVKEIKSFLVDVQDDAVLVHESVITRLASLLPKSDFYGIRKSFMDKLNYTNNLSEFVDVIEDEYKFHKSVNLITKAEVEQAIDSNVAV